MCMVEPIRWGGGGGGNQNFKFVISVSSEERGRKCGKPRRRVVCCGDVS